MNWRIYQLKRWLGRLKPTIAIWLLKSSNKSFASTSDYPIIQVWHNNEVGWFECYIDGKMIPKLRDVVLKDSMEGRIIVVEFEALAEIVITKPQPKGNDQPETHLHE